MSLVKTEELGRSAEVAPAIDSDFDIIVTPNRASDIGRFSFWVLGDDQVVTASVLTEEIIDGTGTLRTITGIGGATTLGEWSVFTFDHLPFGRLVFRIRTGNPAPANLFGFVKGLRKN